jgi:hypothetical protein
MSSVTMVEFISDRISYITLRGRWCDIIVLNVHPPSEDKSMMRRTAFVRNWIVYFMSSRNTTRRFC